MPPAHQERGDLFYETLITLSYVAAIASRAKLGTYVLVVSTRNLLLTAKQVGTLDKLSNGRVLLAIGTGWIKDELDTFGVEYNRSQIILRNS